MVHTIPNIVAWKGEIRRLTSGLTRVRGVCASMGASTIWLNVLAAADTRKVPMLRLSRTGSDTGSGERAKPVVAVSVMRIDRFRLDSWA
jgi:hypothetical protein